MPRMAKPIDPTRVALAAGAGLEALGAGVREVVMELRPPKPKPPKPEPKVQVYDTKEATKMGIGTVAAVAVAIYLLTRKNGKG